MKIKGYLNFVHFVPRWIVLVVVLAISVGLNFSEVTASGMEIDSISISCVRVDAQASTGLQFIAGSFGALIMIISLLLSIIYAILWSFKRKRGYLIASLVFLLVALGSLGLRSLVGTFYLPGSSLISGKP